MQKPDTDGAGVPAVAAEDVAKDVAAVAKDVAAVAKDVAAVADATEDEEEGVMEN